VLCWVAKRKNALQGSRSGDSILQVKWGLRRQCHWHCRRSATAAQVITIQRLDEIFLCMGAQVAIQSFLSPISLNFKLIEENEAKYDGIPMLYELSSAKQSDIYRLCILFPNWTDTLCLNWVYLKFTHYRRNGWSDDLWVNTLHRCVLRNVDSRSCELTVILLSNPLSRVFLFQINSSSRIGWRHDQYWLYIQPMLRCLWRKPGHPTSWRNNRCRSRKPSILT